MREVHHCQTISRRLPSFLFQKGIGASQKILILGESLGRNGWAGSGRPFYSANHKIVPTGKKLDQELSLLKISFEQCSFTEIAKCYLGRNRKALRSCGLRCGRHLARQLKFYKIKLVISLGVITKNILAELFDTELSIGEITSLNLGQRKILALPLYHPSPANPFGHAKNLAIILKRKRMLVSLIKEK